MNLIKRLGDIKLIISVGLLLLSRLSSSYGQLTFDTVYININFENGLDSIIEFSNDTAGTSWQIGQPSKLNFSEAISPTRAILTDTADVVQANTNTWFEIPFVPGDHDSSAFYGFCPLQICFIHRLEKPSSLEAAAWIDIRDNNENYNVGDANFSNGFHGNYYAYNALYAENAYLSWETSYNGEPGFSTPMPETETCYTFWAVSAGAPLNTGIHDTIYFRFNFATTPSANPIWDGWLIDDIRIGRGALYTCYAEGISNNDQIDIVIYPNPSSDEISIQLPWECSNGNIHIEDIYGRIVSETNIKNYDFCTLDLSLLSSGAYYLKLDADGRKAFKKIIKQ